MLNQAAMETEGVSEKGIWFLKQQNLKLWNHPFSQASFVTCYRACKLASTLLLNMAEVSHLKRNNQKYLFLCLSQRYSSQVCKHNFKIRYEVISSQWRNRMHFCVHKIISVVTYNMCKDSTRNLSGFFFVCLRNLFLSTSKITFSLVYLLGH